MDQRTTLIGGAVIIAAFAFIVAQKQGGSEEADLKKQIAGLSEQVAGLEAQLAEVSAQADAQGAALAESATLGSRLAEAVSGMGSAPEAPAAEAAAEPAAAEAETAEAPAAAPADAGGGTMVSAGEAAVFADGSVRVFVSRVDAEAGAARIAVNGVDTVTLSVGEATEAGEGCSVSLGGVEGGKASLSYGCGA